MNTNKRLLAWIAVAIAALSFFLPVMSLTAPIIGQMQWSPYNIVSQVISATHDSGGPSFSDVTKNAGNIVHEAKHASGERTQKVPDEPLGITLAPFIPLELILAYLMVLASGFALIPRRAHGAVKVTGVVSVVCSGVALLSVFLFADAIQSSLRQGMNDPEMKDNPFAALAQAVVSSFRVEPGFGLYVLVAGCVALLVVPRLTLGGEPHDQG